MGEASARGTSFVCACVRSMSMLLLAFAVVSSRKHRQERTAWSRRSRSRTGPRNRLHVSRQLAASLRPAELSWVARRSASILRRPACFPPRSLRKLRHIFALHRVLRMRLNSSSSLSPRPRGNELVSGPARRPRPRPPSSARKRILRRRRRRKEKKRTRGAAVRCGAHTYPRRDRSAQRSVRSL